MGEKAVSFADEAEIRKLYERMMDGWNRGSGEAFAAVFAEDGDQVAFDGTHFQGRAEIAASHQELFDKYLSGTKLTGGIEGVKLPAENVAVAHARGSTIMRGKTKPSVERESIQTLVAAKMGGEWRVVAFDNVRVRPMSRGFGAFVAWKVADVSWRLFGGRG